MTTQINANNIQSSTLATLISGPTITQIQITDSSWTVLDDSAVSTSGGYILITGANFTSGCNVIVNTTAATSVSFVSSTTLRVQVGAATAGTYIVYVVNPDGSTAIMVNGLTYSGTPTWVTTSPLTSGVVDTAISIQLSATGDAPITYALQAGSSLPSGLSLTSGGLLSGTITGLSVETTYNFTVVAIDLEAQDSPKAFSITISVGDTYWDYVTTLLSASTPTTLPFNDDASTNNFAVTINGDTRPYNFNPYTPGYYSNYFDGTGDYLSTSSSSALSLPGDFTFEAWIYLNAGGAAAGFVSTHQPSTTYGVLLGMSAANVLLCRIGTDSVGFQATDSVALSTGIWYHVAAVRSGNTMTLYKNGVSVASVGSITITSDTTTAVVGRYYTDTNNFYLNGYVSNARIVKGTAVYTSAFTPPTSPLTAISGTSLLTCQSNRLIDTSTNALTITKNGDTKVSSFIPYTPNSSYSTYGSTYFDGTGDYLTAPANAAFALSTSDFTLEDFVYPTATISAIKTINQYGEAAVTNYNNISYAFYANASGYVVFEASNGVSAAFITLTSSVLLPINAWTHLAVVRSGTSFVLYQNGVSVASGTASNSFYVPANPLFWVGRNHNGGYDWTGYISNVRLVKGTAVYTSAFTPPTTPLTAISGTSLLTCQSNQPVANNTFLDNSTNNFAITRNGNTTQGTFSPYGVNWSNYFNGSTDYLDVGVGGAGITLSANWTFELWIYATGTSGIVFDCRPTSTNGYYPEISISSSTQLDFYYNSASHLITVSNLLNNWNHIAIVKNSGTLTVYYNGTSVYSVSDSNTWSISSARPRIGANGGYFGAAPSYYTGYASNFRVVNGTAVYTSAFTPSTTPLQAIANTILLTLQSPNVKDNSPNNYTITKNGTGPLQKFGPFSATTLPTPYYSAYFDGTGDYLQLPSSSPAMGSGSFTLECWVYPQSTAATIKAIYGWRSGNDTSPYLSLDSANKPQFGGDTTTYFVSSTAVTVNAWNHIAVVRSGTSMAIFLNGSRVGTATSSQNFSFSTGTDIGALNGASPYYFTGYISNLRQVTGTAVYDPAQTSITVPTSPLTAISGTSLLTCQSSTFVDNSTNNFTITATGNSQPTTVNPFTVTYSTGQSYTPSVFGGSMYFDGTGDYLTAPSNAAFQFGTGDFTIEMWVFPTANQPQFCRYFGTGATIGDATLDQQASGLTPTFNDNNTVFITSSIALTLNAWNHLAVTRSGTSLKMFVNGVVSGTATNSTNFTCTGNAIIGKNPGSAVYSTGYFSDVRIVKGTAVYTSNFVPQNTPLQAVKNSTLLLNGTSAGIYDSSEMANYETVGDVKLSTTTVKFSGSTSMYFDGTGDYLISPNYPTFNIGSGNFTIEGWFYITSNVTAGLISKWTDGGNQRGWKLDARSNGTFTFYYSTTGADFPVVTFTGSLDVNSWTHLALVRNSSTLALYKNGTSLGSSAFTSTIFANTSQFCLGVWLVSTSTPETTGVVAYPGYMSDVRITNGIARYTSNFTAPTSPFITK